MTNVTHHDLRKDERWGVPSDVAATGIPGLDASLAWLLDEHAAIVKRGKGGRTVFVVGDDGSGCATLLRRVADNVRCAKPRPAVIGGAFRDREFVPWEKKRSRANRVLEELEQTVDLVKALDPIIALIDEVLTQSKAAAKLIHSHRRRSTRIGPTDVLPMLLRELCRERPVVCLVEDAHLHPGELWVDLVVGFAARIAKDLPLLLVLGTDGPSELGDHEDDEPDSLFLPRTLVGNGIAQWRPLERVTVDELERWTGPASHELLQQLLDVTSGRAEWTAELWHHWREHNVVTRGSKNGKWRFAADGLARAMDPVEDVLGRRMRQLVGDDVKALGRTRELLSCGALEGRRFTADAVAQALGRPPEGLLDGRKPLDDPRDGLLADAGPTLVIDDGGQRRLRRYRFGAELMWLTLSHAHDLSPAKRRQRAGELANALRALYGAQAHRVAAVLARLYGLAGEVEAAGYYQRLADMGVNRMIILWRAQDILNSPEPQERAARRRASQVLLTAAELLLLSGPFHQGRRFAEAARLLAPLVRDEARSAYLAAVHGSRIGLRQEARRELDDVIGRYRELRDRRGEASARLALATIDMDEGDYTTAGVQFAEVLSVFRDLGDRRNEAHALHQLAGVLIAERDFSGARERFEEAFHVFRKLGDLEGMAGALLQLAGLRIEVGDLDDAVNELNAVLALFDELGDRDGEAAARRYLAHVHLERRAYRRARDELEVAFRLLSEVGSRDHAQAVANELARIPSDR